MQIVLESARIVVSLIFLLYASWSDYKTREVSNTVWILFAPLASTLTFLEILIYTFPQLFLQLSSYGICFGLTAAFAVVLFYSGGFGGADAKAFMCIALALPFHPENLLGPIHGEISPISQNLFPITVFTNSVLLAASTAIYMLLVNLFWRLKSGRRLFREDHENESLGRKLLVLITGYKVRIKKLEEKWHLYPLEDVESVENETKRRLIVFPKDEGRNAIVERLSDAVEAGRIQDEIWVTPGLPMLIYISIGLIIALFFGDIVWICVNLLLG